MLKFAFHTKGKRNERKRADKNIWIEKDGSKEKLKYYTMISFLTCHIHVMFFLNN
jgi:hypothetical protein